MRFTTIKYWKRFDTIGEKVFLLLFLVFIALGLMPFCGRHVDTLCVGLADKKHKNTPTQHPATPHHEQTRQGDPPRARHQRLCGRRAKPLSGGIHPRMPGRFGLLPCERQRFRHAVQRHAGDLRSKRARARGTRGHACV